MSLVNGTVSLALFGIYLDAVHSLEGYWRCADAGGLTLVELTFCCTCDTSCKLYIHSSTSSYWSPLRLSIPLYSCLPCHSQHTEVNWLCSATSARVSSTRWSVYFPGVSCLFSNMPNGCSYCCDKVICKKWYISEQSILRNVERKFFLWKLC